MNRPYLRGFFPGIIVTLSIFFINVGFLFGQAPESINYQAVARDNNGNLITNTAIDVRVGIRSGSLSGLLEYQEEFTVTTSPFGVFSVQIGTGLQTGNGNLVAFSDINWGLSSHFLQVELKNDAADYEDLGTTRLLSVPYALYAKSSGSGDLDSLNERITSVGLIGDSIVLIENDSTFYVDLSKYASSVNNDNDSTNELVDSLRLSNGVLELFQQGVIQGSISLDTLGDYNRFLLEQQIGFNRSDLTILTASFTTDSLLTAQNRDSIDVVVNNLNTHLAADFDTDTLNERIVSAQLVGDSIVIIENDSTFYIDLTKYNAAINNDNDSTNELVDSLRLTNGVLELFQQGAIQASINLDTLGDYNRLLLVQQIGLYRSDLNILNNSFTQDSLLTIRNRDSIDAVVNNLNNHLAADFDTDTLNERIVSAQLVGDSIVIIENDSTFYVNLTKYNAAINNDNDSTNELVDSLRLSNGVLQLFQQGAIQGFINLDTLGDYQRFLLEQQIGFNRSDITNLTTSFTADSSLTIQNRDSIDVVVSNLNAHLSLDADQDPTNELQTLSFTGTDLILSVPPPANSTSISLAALVDDADADPTNELQSISFDITGDSLVLSNGNSLSVTRFRDSSLADLADTANALRNMLPSTDEFLKGKLMSSTDIGLVSFYETLDSLSPSNLYYDGNNFGIDNFSPNARLDIYSSTSALRAVAAAEGKVKAGNFTAVNLGADTAMGIHVRARGPLSYNVAAYFEEGSVLINDSLRLAGPLSYTPGAANGLVLTSDASGNATWQSTVGDNLGNHIASQNIQLNGQYLSNDGGNEGIRINNDGNVGIGSLPNTNATLFLESTEDKAAYFIQNGTEPTKVAVFGEVSGPGTSAFALEGDANSIATSNYGLHAVARGTGTGTNYGVYGKAIGAVRNWSGYFDDGNVFVKDTLVIPTGAGVGKLLTSDATGKASWETPNFGDDLGNHIVTQNIQLNGFFLSNDGDNEGLFIAPNGNVTVGSNKGTRQFGVWSESGPAEMGIISEDSTSEIKMGAYGNTSINSISAYRARGNWTTKSAVVAGDNIFSLNVQPYDGTGSVITRALNVSVESILSSNVATRMSLFTRNSSGLNAERFTITGAGRIGINTTSPAQMLDVNGAATIDTLNINSQYTFPTFDGSNGDLLRTDGSGNVSFVNPSAVFSTDTLPIIQSTDRSSYLSIRSTNQFDLSLSGTTYLVIDTVNNTGLKPTMRFQFRDNGDNIILGENSGNNISNTGGNGVRNIIIGNNSGNGATDYSNVLIGTNVGVSGVTAQNVAIGGNAAQFGLNRSVAIGLQAGQAGGLDFSVAIGYNAASSVNGSSNSVLIGSNVANSLLNGQENTILGALAGGSLTSGGQNTFVGFNSGFNTTGEKNVFIGAYSGFNEIGSEKLYIANDSTSTPLIYGNFLSDSLIFNGSVTIDSAKDGSGYTMPGYRGNIGQVLTSDGAGNLYWGTNTIAVSCPTGMIEVGSGKLCVDSIQSSVAVNWFTAASSCAAQGKKLPSWGEWYAATDNETLADEIDDWEWVDDGTSNTVRKVGNGSLKSTSNDDPESGIANYRCVTYK
jgi:hypothetical protein